jgi:hypothetical protein
MEIGGVAGPSPNRLSQQEAAAVRQQLDLILSDPVFGHSRRYPAFLRYVVERTLEGGRDGIKERIIGVEALGRAPTYDSGQDPVVRTTAAEVRRRLAQHYQRMSRTPAVRIEIPVGSYVPEFVFEPVLRPSGREQASGRWLTSRRAALVLLLAGIPATAALYLRAWSPTSQERFWAPLLSADGSLLVCVGPAAQNAWRSTEVSQRSSYNSAALHPVTINAATAAARIAGFLETHGKAFEMKSTESVEFAQLRERPIVAIGGNNNRWTLMVTRSLRYRFDGADARILDSEQPQAPGWRRRVDRSSGQPKVVEDFAIVARVRDASTGKFVLAIGGIGHHGTTAAGEFVTDPDRLSAFASHLPRGWERRNLEVVLQTTVVDDVAGPPHVVASAFWD